MRLFTKILMILISLLLYKINLSAQPSNKISLIKIDNSGDSLWAKIYPKDTVYIYEVYSVEQTSDRGYIITANKNYNTYLLKTDSIGDTLWTRIYGGDFNLGRSVKQTTDGGYIIAGCSDYYGPPGVNIFLIKTDSIGDTLWTKFYIKPYDQWGWSVYQTLEGGYIISGWEGDRHDRRDAYLLKTDSIGDTLWSRTYGGDGDDFVNDNYSVQQTTDRGYITVGYTYSFGAGKSDVYLIKTDSLGDTLWTKIHCLFDGKNRDVGRSVQQTTDGGYIIAGWTDSFGSGLTHVYLIKTDGQGDTLWTKAVSGSAWEDFGGYSVQQTKDKGYVLGGDRSIWKTDSLGNLMWENNNFGGRVRQTNDRGYIIVNTVFIPNAVEEYNPNIYSVSQGNPNPFNNISSIDYELPKRCHVQILVYNVIGQVIRELENKIKGSGKHTIVWDGKDKEGNKLPNGFYFFRLEAGDNKTTRKLILLR